jgi:lipopolysaccharide transport system ATP-binding protein
VVSGYLGSLASQEAVPLDQREDRAGDGSVRVRSIRIESADADRVVRTASRIRVTIEYRSAAPLRYAQFLVGVYDQASVGIFLLDSDAVAGLPDVLPAEGTVTCVTDPINLTPGRCFVNVAVLKAGSLADHVQYAAHLDVEPEYAYGFTKLPERSWMLCILPQAWSVDGHGQ